MFDSICYFSATACNSDACIPASGYHCLRSIANSPAYIYIGARDGYHGTHCGGNPDDCAIRTDHSGYGSHE